MSVVFDKTRGFFPCKVDKKTNPLFKSSVNATPYVFGGSLCLPFVSFCLFSGRSCHPSRHG